MKAIRFALTFAGAVMALQAAGGDPPDWVRQAAAANVPAYPLRVTSVVLLREEVVSVDPDGRRVMRERGAIRVLQKGGDPLRAYRTYDTKAGRIRDFQGWLLPPGGKPVIYDSKKVLDIALVRDNTYDEARAKVIDCGAMPPGSVFAWEVTEEEKTVFTQYPFWFQESAPVLVSRLSLTLPAGWEARGHIFNHEEIGPQTAGSTFTWELRDLPWIEPQDHSPRLPALSPRIAISYFPAADNKAGLTGLKDWTAVSVWLSQLMDPAAEVTAAVRAKATELTAGAATDLDKIRAIGSFVQKTNYVEVALNVTRGGGYTPHAAGETLARNYGDCKDKATLMRALLRAAGITSWVTVIYSGDRDYVRPEWASPHQFNHAIVAVQVADSVKLPVIADSPLGHLLMFDPTDPITPLGGLPLDEQGSNALVIAGTSGALLPMPTVPSRGNRIEASVEGSVAVQGAVKAHIQRQYFGQSATRLRAIERLGSDAELRQVLERAWSRNVDGAELTGIGTRESPAENELTVDLDISAGHFAQNMQGRLLVVRPGLLTSGGEYFFASENRVRPIRLEADLRRETIRLQAPEGFTPDEIPRPVTIESPYGTIEANWAIEDNAITMSQTLEVRRMTAPASEYAAIRKFFEQLAGVQAAPVVLRSK